MVLVSRFKRLLRFRRLRRLARNQDVEGLLSILTSQADMPTRTDCRNAIVQLGDRAVPYLANCLGYAEAAMRREAAEMLAQIPSEYALHALVGALYNQEHMTCNAAVHALIARGRQAVPYLLQTLKSPSPAGRAAAVDALDQLDSVPSDVEGKVLYLGAKGDIQCLAALGRPDPSPLRRALTRGPAHLRLAAVRALALIRQPSAVDVLGQALRDPEPAVRWGAIEDLSKIHTPAAIRALLSTARRDDIAGVRVPAIIDGLERCLDSSTTDLMQLALYDWSPEVRAAAARQLGNLRAATSVGALLARLADSDTDVRRAAVAALEDIGPSVLDHLNTGMVYQLCEIDWIAAGGQSRRTSYHLSDLEEQLSLFKADVEYLRRYNDLAYTASFAALSPEDKKWLLWLALHGGDPDVHAVARRLMRQFSFAEDDILRLPHQKLSKRCRTCGARVLTGTAARFGGLCRACHGDSPQRIRGALYRAKPLTLETMRRPSDAQRVTVQTMRSPWDADRAAASAAALDGETSRVMELLVRYSQLTFHEQSAIEGYYDYENVPVRSEYIRWDDVHHYRQMQRTTTTGGTFIANYEALYSVEKKALFRRISEEHRRIRCVRCARPLRIIRKGQDVVRRICPKCEIDPGICPDCGGKLRTESHQKCRLCKAEWYSTVSTLP